MPHDGSCWVAGEPAEPWPPVEHTAAGEEVELQQIHVEAQLQLQGATSWSEHLGTIDEAEVQLCPRRCASSPTLLPRLL